MKTGEAEMSVEMQHAGDAQRRQDDASHDASQKGGKDGGAQAKAGQAAVARMAGGIDPACFLKAQGKAIELAAGGLRDVNELTDEAFKIACPDVHGKLAAGTPEAAEWMRVRDEIAKPALAMTPPKPKAEAAAAPKTDPAPTVQGPVAAGDKSTEGQGKAGSHYFTQNDNKYNDGDTIKQWGEQGALLGTCNATTLTMALVDLSGGNEGQVREAVVAKLKSTPLRAGAVVSVGGKIVALKKVLADDALVGAAQLPDLIIAYAMDMSHGNIQKLKSPEFVMSVGTALGISKSVAPAKGQQSLATKKGRDAAREKLANGEKLIIATPGHFTYLVEVRDDGVVLDDPCGLRFQCADAKQAEFMYSGSIRPDSWADMMQNAAHAKVIQRRASTNPAAAAMVERVKNLNKLSGKAHAEEVKALKAMDVQMGEKNFYGAEDFADWDLSIRMDMASADGGKTK